MPGGAPEMGGGVGAGPPGRQPRPEQSHLAQWDPGFRRGQGALGPLSKEWPLAAPWPGMQRAHSAALETQANPGHPQPRPRLSGHPGTQPAALPGGGGATTSQGTQTGVAPNAILATRTLVLPRGGGGHGGQSRLQVASPPPAEGHSSGHTWTPVGPSFVMARVQPHRNMPKPPPSLARLRELLSRAQQPDLQQRTKHY